MVILLLFGYGILYFFLKDTLLFTPDFSGTDAFHFTVSYKYYLWQSIRSGSIPFWTDLLNGGFPLVAESQMGTFFLPHYLIFPFFSSFPHAYAFLFSFHLFLLSIGMYLLLRRFKVPSFLSFLLAVILTWNGSIAFRWVHFTVLQSFSFTPLLFLIYFKWNESQKMKYLFYLSLIVNQMIFAGYIQAVFIVLLGIVLLYVIQNWPLTRSKTVLFISSLLMGILLSLPQILPTLQLSRYTNRSLSSSYDFAVSVPFNLRNICAFFSADCLGSAKDATYSSNWHRDGIYWENTPYLGQYFVVILLLSSIYYFVRRKKNKIASIFLFLSFIFLLLALGKNSPLYFLFSIFPFTMFRTPPRYLLLSVFFLIMYAGFALTYSVKKNTYIALIIYSALILNCVLLIRTVFSYHLFIDSSHVLQSLATQKTVKPGSHYMTYGSQEEWNTIFLKQGWNSKKSADIYVFINRALLPNSNLISGQSNFDMYASLEMRRQQFLKSLIVDGLNSESSRSAQIENVLRIYNIGSIISFKPLFLPHFKPVQTMKRGGIMITTYQNEGNGNVNEYYVPKTIQKIVNKEELEEKIKTGTFTQEDSLAESIPATIVRNSQKMSLQIQKKEDAYMRSTITTDNDMFIVFRKNWYPEWRLYIDGKEDVIYKTNLIHIGFFVPKGTHTIELRYVPMSFYVGCALSLLSVFTVLVVWLKTIKRGK